MPGLHQQLLGVLNHRSLRRHCRDILSLDIYRPRIYIYALQSYKGPSAYGLLFLIHNIAFYCLQVPCLSTDFGWHSSPATWNSIPTCIKNCSSLYSFKHHLKSHLIAQFINNLHTPSGHLATTRASDSWLCVSYKLSSYYYYHYWRWYC